MGLFKWRGRSKSGPEDDSPAALDLTPEPSPVAEAEEQAPAEADEEVATSGPEKDERTPAATDMSSEAALLEMVNKLVQPNPPLNGASAQADSYESSEYASGPAPGEAADDNAGGPLGDFAFEQAGSPPPPAPLLADLAPAPEDQDLARLRRLILSREIDGLESIHQQLADRDQRIQALSQIVTEAIRQRVIHDDELIGVLKPTVDNIVRNSVRSNPNEMAENLFPVIGPAIRRSISESIKGMLQDFSRTLEKSLSLTGLKWRLEAARTGRPFSEVVLLKTLEYQVEQIFVIHADSGLPLIHLVNSEAHEQAKDPDQVAAMLTAIEHFVNDSFAQGGLDTLEFGDRKVFVSRAPRAYLACVVRGEPPANLRIDMQTALELLVMECADDLDEFQGDSRPFAKAQRHFEALLVSRFKGESKKLSLRAKMPLIALLLILVGLLGFIVFKKVETSRLEAMVYQASSAPGVVPLRVTPRLFGRWDIVCLKDEAAPSLEQALIDGGLAASRFSIRYLPYVSNDPDIVAKKLEPIMESLPVGIETAFEPQNNTLYLRGSAPLAWLYNNYERLTTTPGLARVDLNGLRLIDNNNKVTARLDLNGVMHFQGEASVSWRESTRERVLKIPGINGVQLSEVKDDPATARIKALVQGINDTVIFFPLGKDQPVPADAPKLEEAANRLTELEMLADSMDLSVNLVIYGHADATGSQKLNYTLSQNRAQTLAAMLYAKGCRIPIALYGMGDDFAAGRGDPSRKPSDNQDSRKIEMRVHLNRKGSSLVLD